MKVYREDTNGVARHAPDFGAIFMSNRATKSECFKNGIFGLPLAQANFVKQVKAGMALFLFEFEERQLFGVYRAISDGEINIMPNAFKSLGKQFPSQVRFTSIWHCRPLFEDEFRDAIRDNYYSGKKFYFGLSKDQVHRLLLLFSRRKLKYEGSDRRLTRVPGSIVKERRRLDDARNLIRDRARLDDARNLSRYRDRLEPDLHEGTQPVFLREFGRHSSENSKREDDELSSRGDTGDNKNKVGYDQVETFHSPGAGNCVDYDARFLVNDEGEIHYYGQTRRQGIMGKDFEDSLVIGRMMDEGLLGNMVKDESEMNNLGPVVARQFTGNKERYLMHGYDTDNISGLIFSDNENPKLGRSDDGRFLIDNFSVKNEYDMGNGLCSTYTEEEPGEHPRKIATGSGRFFMNNSNSLGPVVSSEHIGNHDGMFQMNEHVEEHAHNTLVKRPPATTGRAIDDGMFSIRQRVKSEHDADGIFGLATSTKYSSYNSVEDNQVGGNDSRYRKSNRLENRCANGSFLGPANDCTLSHSKQHTSTYNGDELSTLLGKPCNSSGFLCPDDQYIPHLSNSTSHNAIAASAVPYDPDVPDIFRGYSSSAATGLGYSSVQNLPSYQGWTGNICSVVKTESPLHQFEAGGSRRYFDVAADHGDATSYPGHQKDSYGTFITSTRDGYSENRDFKTPAEHSFNDPFSPDLSASFPPSKAQTYEADCKNPSSNSYFSNMKYEDDAGSHDKYGYNIGGGTTAKGLPSSDKRWSCLQNAACHLEARLIPRIKGSIGKDDKLCRSEEHKSSNTSSKRVSVFARLAAAPEVRVQEQEHDIDAVGDECDMDASVERLMDILHHGLSNQAKKKSKNEFNVKPQNEGIANLKKTIITTSEQEYEQSNAKVGLAPSQTIEKACGAILEETRHIDFKRRREAKKNVDRVCKENSAGIVESKRPAEENAETRRSTGKESIEMAKMGPAPSQTTEKACGPILEETRHIDFKRRSEAKKNVDGTCKENSAGIMESKRPAEENAETRRSTGKESTEKAKVGVTPSQTTEKACGTILEVTRHINVKRRGEAKKNVDETCKENSAGIMESKRPAEENAETRCSASNETIEQACETILEETRHIDFKRRSEAKKNVDGTYKENSAGIMESKRPAEGNAETRCSAGKELTETASVDSPMISLCKRRKLVRPVFDKTEWDEVSNFSISAGLQSASLENPHKEKAATLQEAIKSSEYIEATSNLVSSPARHEASNLVSSLACHEANMAEAEKGSESSGKINSGNYQSPSSCPQGGHGNYQPQDKGNSVLIAQEPMNDGSKLCGWIEW